MWQLAKLRIDAALDFFVNVFDFDIIWLHNSAAVVIFRLFWCLALILGDD